MSLLFSHGTFEVVLYKGGLRYDKAKSNNSIGAEALFRSISSVRVKTQAASQSTISVELTPSMEDAFEILSAGLLGVGVTYDGQKGSGSSSEKSVKPKEASTNQVRQDISLGLANSVVPYLAVKLFYPDELLSDGLVAETPWFGGNLRTPDISFDGSEITITIHAAGAFQILNQMEGTEIFKDQPLLEVLNKLSAKSGTKITFEDAETEKWLNEKRVTGAYNDVKFSLIKRLLKESDCLFVASSGDDKQPQEQIKVKKRSSISSGDVKHTFVVWRQPDLSNNQYPVLSLNVDGFQSQFSPGSMFGTKMNVVNTSTKKYKSVFFGGEDDLVDKASATGTAPGNLPMASGDGDSVGGANGAKDVGPSDAGASMPSLKTADADMKDEAESNSKSNFVNSIKMRITVPGIPDLRPMSLAYMIFGDNYPGLSGVGIISSVEHICDSDGWRTDIEFNRSDSIATAGRRAGFIKTKPEEKKNNAAGGTIKKPKAVKK